MSAVVPILLQKSPTRGGRPAASGFSRTTASPVLPLAPLGAAAWLNALLQLRPGPTLTQHTRRQLAAVARRAWPACAGSGRSLPA